jgi:hypothetical protein
MKLYEVRTGGKPGVRVKYWRAQRRVAQSNGWKSRRGKSQSHVAWMAGGKGNASFRSPRLIGGLGGQVLQSHIS